MKNSLQLILLVFLTISSGLVFGQNLKSANPKVLKTAKNSVAANPGDINIASGTFNIGATGAVSTNTFVVSGTGTSEMVSDATNSGSLIVTGASSGTVTYKRYLGSGNWHLISSPIADQALGVFVSNPLNSVKYNSSYNDYDLAPYYEAEDGWSPYTAGDESSNFLVGKGYSVRRDGIGTVIFNGTINLGTITADIIRTGSATGVGWNALGNPYTSPMRVRGENSFLETNVSVLDESFAGVYVWDQSLNDYVVIHESAFTFPTPGAEDSISQNYLAVGQGFIVKAKDDGSLPATHTVTFESFMQAHTDTLAIPFKSGEISWPAIRLSVNTGTTQNRTIVAFNNSMKLGLDPSFDMGKFKGNPNLALYTQLIEDNGVEFAVQALPENDYEKYRIPVGLDFSTGGFVTFTTEYINLTTGMQVILEDTQEKTFTRLDIDKAKYVTSIQQNASGFGRFFILMSDALVTSVEELNKADFKAFANRGEIHIHGETDRSTIFSIYGIDGKLWYQNKAEDQNYNTINTSSFATGVYLLRINKQGVYSTHKIVISGQ